MPSAAELARAALWRDQRKRRIAKREELERAFVGDPAALAALRADYQPLVNAAADAKLPPEPQDIESPVIANHDLNL